MRELRVVRAVGRHLGCGPQEGVGSGQRLKRVVAVPLLPARNDAVARLPRLSHETRRLSGAHFDGVEATWSHEDAIAATASSSSSDYTLSQHPKTIDASFSRTISRISGWSLRPFATMCFSGVPKWAANAT